MHLCVSRKNGVIEVNFSWMPYFMALDKTLQETIVEKLKKIAPGEQVTDELLFRLDAVIIETVNQRYPEFVGIGDYLKALKHVRQR